MKRCFVLLAIIRERERLQADEELRNNIDQVDQEIVQLLEKRMTIVQEISQEKQAQKITILDNSREQAGASARSPAAEAHRHARTALGQPGSGQEGHPR